jgi:putative MFS transporter
MGAAAGGLLPVANALLAETMPTRHRGWSLVLVGGIGAVGGYFAASGLSALLQPDFGWRIMWFLNLPTGVALILLSPFLPESARFLQRVGRIDEARKVLARFGMGVRHSVAPLRAPLRAPTRALPTLLTGHHLVGMIGALTLGGIGWGLVNFGLLLWLPVELVARGYSMEVSSRLLAASALIDEGRSVGAASALVAQSALLAAPTILACAFLYSRWSTKWTLVLTMLVTLAGLVGLALQEAGPVGLAHPLLPLTLVVVGSSGVIAILLPYTAENFPIRVRGRATGWVAACSKIGGLLAQALSVADFVPAFSVAAVLVGLPVLASLALTMRYGRETRRRDLRDLEAAGEAAV